MGSSPEGLGMAGMSRWSREAGHAGLSRGTRPTTTSRPWFRWGIGPRLFDLKSLHVLLDSGSVEGVAESVPVLRVVGDVLDC